MILSDISVRRPVLGGVLSLVLLLVGLVSYSRLPVRDLPAIEPPIVSVQTTYRGANAEVVEHRITQLVEDQLSGIEGIETITSRSRDGRSDVIVEFSPKRDIDAAANDVRDRVSSTYDRLPEDADPPRIRKVDVDAQAIIWITVTHPEWSSMRISDYVDRVLVDRFSAVNGVSRVDISAEARPAMRVWLSRQRLDVYAMTPADIETALRQQNVELPAGRIEGPSTNLSVRVTRQFTTPEQFRRMVVGRSSDGHLIRLGDVARVDLEPEDRYSFYESNGERAIGLGVVRQSGANTLQVAHDVKAELARVQQILPDGMSAVVNFDSSLFIERAIDNVWHTLFEAAALVIAVIFLFLGSARATLIPALTVPICLIATFAVLLMLGYSLNLLTLLAFVLAIGLVVDDAIVVLENIHYGLERGEPPLAAAFLGAREVGFAVLSTTIVVCAVFVPLYFISGETGELFHELAGAMIGAVAFSGFVALSLTPMLCSKLLRADHRQTRLGHWFNARLDGLRVRYHRSLETLIDRPWLVGGCAVAFIALCLVLGLRLPSELAPAEDLGYFNVNTQSVEGTSFARMARNMEELQAKVLPMTAGDGPLERVATRVPGNFGNTEDYSSGLMLVFLKPWEQRTVSTQHVMNDVQQIINTDPHLRGNATTGNLLARRAGRPIRMVIAGSSYDDLARARDAIFAAAGPDSGIVDLDSNYKETRPQLIVDIDITRAGDLGVPIVDVASTLETMMGSRRVTTFIDGGEEYYVVVQAEDADRANINNLSSIYVRSTTSGQRVPLSNLVSFREVAQAGELAHFNKQRAITLEGGLAPGMTLGTALDFLEKVALEQPEVTNVGYLGESRQLRQTGSSLWSALGLTVILVFLVLAAQFESWVHPVVIILTVPLALGGGLFGLWLMGGTINLYSQVGIVMLVGLAAKNGILIVEFANQLRDRGVEFRLAIMQASERRLRPVLMTSVATAAGALPLMLASGAGAGARRAIGTVIVWGVSLATLLTLFVIPVFYLAFARRTTSPLEITRKLDRELDELRDGNAETRS